MTWVWSPPDGPCTSSCTVSFVGWRTSFSEGASGFDIAPLFASEPRQVPFLNEAQQVETRWSVDLVMQVNPLVTVPQDFAQSLDISTTGIP